MLATVWLELQGQALFFFQVLARIQMPSQLAWSQLGPSIDGSGNTFSPYFPEYAEFYNFIRFILQIIPPGARWL